MREPWEGIDIYEFLVNLEPMKHGSKGMPIKQIEYGPNHVFIHFYTPEELDSLWIDWWDE